MVKSLVEKNIFQTCKLIILRRKNPNTTMNFEQACYPSPAPASAADHQWTNQPAVQVLSNRKRVVVCEEMYDCIASSLKKKIFIVPLLHLRWSSTLTLNTLPAPRLALCSCWCTRYMCEFHLWHKDFYDDSKRTENIVQPHKDDFFDHFML